MILSKNEEVAKRQSLGIQEIVGSAIKERDEHLMSGTAQGPRLKNKYSPEAPEHKKSSQITHDEQSDVSVLDNVLQQPTFGAA